MSILDEIVEQRKKRISEKGAAGGMVLPPDRQVPLVPFGSGVVFAETDGEMGRPGKSGRICCAERYFVIAEVKGRSPSAGTIKEDMDPVAAASIYASAGIREISVLTEEDNFGGSLEYLVNIKKNFPELSVLRKDFLFSEEDIEVSYQAGADAVLLIASILENGEIERLMKKASSLGIRALVEVHDGDEIEKIRELRPDLVGINSRDLKTFRTDLALPMMLAGKIDWPSSIVFESGIKSAASAIYAFDGGFSGILCGEALMKDEKLAASLADLAAEKSLSFAPLPGSDTAAAFSGSRATVAGLSGHAAGLSVSKASFSTRIDVDLSKAAGPSIRPAGPSMQAYGLSGQQTGSATPKAGSSTQMVSASARIDSRQDLQVNFSAQKAALSSPETGSAMLTAGSPGRTACPSIKAACSRYFWRKLYSCRKPGRGKRPLVKICGITNREDAAAAAGLGADILGLVYADSPRRAEFSLPEIISDIDVLKAAVVRNPDNELLVRLKLLYDRGLIDAVQFHGNESPELCAGAGIPWYKAFSYPAGGQGSVPVTANNIAQRYSAYSCPRFLTDSSASGREGGTGVRTDSGTVYAAAGAGVLWLAGGLSDENISSVIEKYSPELVDASSRLESAPGKKDHAKLESFFEVIDRF